MGGWIENRDYAADDMWKDKEVKFFSLQFLLFLSKSYRVIVWVKEKYEDLRFLYDH